MQNLSIGATHESQLAAPNAGNDFQTSLGSPLSFESRDWCRFSRASFRGAVATRSSCRVPQLIGATHHLFIATNSALQQFRILWTMDGTNCASLEQKLCKLESIRQAQLWLLNHPPRKLTLRFTRAIQLLHELLAGECFLGTRLRTHPNRRQRGSRSSQGHREDPLHFVSPGRDHALSQLRRARNQSPVEGDLH